jgi:hypothetical protein
MHPLGERGTNGVNRIVAVETFGLQARESCRDWELVTHRDLGLDNRVERSVRPRVRQVDPSSTVVPKD